jgi:hypothetical protein
MSGVISCQFWFPGKRDTDLIVAAPDFLFYLDWLVEHEIRLENPFSDCIFACLVALRWT